AASPTSQRSQKRSPLGRPIETNITPKPIGSSPPTMPASNSRGYTPNFERLGRLGRSCSLRPPSASHLATGASGRSIIRKEEKSVSDMVSRESAYEYTHITYVTRCPMQEGAMTVVRIVYVYNISH